MTGMWNSNLDNVTPPPPKKKKKKKQKKDGRLQGSAAMQFRPLLF